MVTEERGGMAGAGQGTCALHKAGERERKSSFCDCRPQT